MERNFVKSRYIQLQICFVAYSKLQLFSNIIPYYQNYHDFMYLRFSIQMLKETNMEYFRKVKELSDLEISKPFDFTSHTPSMAKAFEADQMRKAELAKEVNELNYRHPDFLFTLEESLHLFDFFDKLII